MTAPPRSSLLVLSVPSRRRWLAGTAGALGALLVDRAAVRAEAPATEAPEPILKQGERIEFDGDPEAILQTAYDLGHRYEGRFGGCAQCTMAALQDALPFMPKDRGLFRAACPLDGGATPVGEQNCGSFTGSAMVIGYLTGRTRTDKGFTGSTGLAHRLVHRLYARYKEHYGTVLCRDVRKGAGADCPKVVGRAARWTAEILLAEFGPPS